jgi:hypothetical protein|tara:strand:+ start:26887 stop:27108 length:222 start_codon:yes stop_codon:yes gene_type:complete
MAKQIVQANPKSQSALEELDTLLEFCRDFGYRYNEADLYNFKSYAWQQYTKFTQGKNARDMWAEDARRLNRNI